MTGNESQFYVWLAVNTGIAGVMLFIVFSAYQKLVAQLRDIIEKNTAAMTSMQGVIAVLCDKVDKDKK